MAPAGVPWTINLVPTGIEVELAMAGIGISASAGNAVILRLDPSGQDEIRGAASEKTDRTPSGVSKAEGMAAVLASVLIKV